MYSDKSSDKSSDKYVMTYMSPLQANVSSFVSLVNHMYKNYKIMNTSLTRTYTNNKIKTYRIPVPGKKIRPRGIAKGQNLIKPLPNKNTPSRTPKYTTEITPQILSSTKLQNNIQQSSSKVASMLPDNTQYFQTPKGKRKLVFSETQVNLPTQINKYNYKDQQQSPTKLGHGKKLSPQLVPDFVHTQTPKKTPMTPKKTPMTPKKTPMTPKKTPMTPKKTPMTPKKTPMTPMTLMTPMTPMTPKVRQQISNTPQKSSKALSSVKSETPVKSTTGVGYVDYFTPALQGYTERSRRPPRYTERSRRTRRYTERSRRTPRYSLSELPSTRLSFSDEAVVPDTAQAAGGRCKQRAKRGGARGEKKTYLYQDIIKVWHLFDTKHDFGVKYKISQNTINSIETSENVKNLYYEFIDKSLQESSVANELLLYANNKNNSKIKNNLFNLKIFYNKGASDMFELTKKTFKVHQSVPATIGQFLFKNKSLNQCFYLQDIHINNMTSQAWEIFETNILKKVSNKVVPFEKLWDPLISKIPPVESDEYPCKKERETRKRVDYIYNKSLDTQNDIENEFAFRNLTKQYFNISFQCVDNKYKGVTFILMQTNGAYAETLRKQYVNFINYINSKDVGFSIFDKNDKVCITADINGFSKENIKETIKFLETKGLLIHHNLTNTDYLRNYTSNDNIKTLILFFICHIYFKRNGAGIDVIKAILYDLKKSGDWGQALYCKYMNKVAKDTTTCFVSGDMLSAFYSVLHDTPTIIGSSRPKNKEEEYNQLQIYTGDEDFSFAYIQNVIVSYMKNELLYSLQQYKDIHESLKTQINNIVSQWDAYIQNVTSMLKPNNFQTTDDITFDRYPKHFFDLIVKSRDTANRNPSQDVIRQILIQFLELYNQIWEFFKLLKPNANLEQYMHDFVQMIVQHYDDERHKIYISAQSAIVGDEVRDKLAIQKACYDGLNIFKDTLNYCSDMLYIVYVFIIDDDKDEDKMDVDEEMVKNNTHQNIYFVINQFAKNMLSYLIVTKAFLNQNPAIKNTRSPFNLRDMLPNLNNPHSSLLRDILQKESMSQNVNNPRDKALQELTKICSFYEMMLFDMRDLITSIKYDIIEKVRLIENDTPIYKFKELFSKIVIPKINNALTFNINTEIDEICKRKMIPEADCNKIRETFPILSNDNSIYHISNFIYVILEDLQKQSYETLRPHLQEKAQEKGDVKIESQIQINVGKVNELKTKLRKEFAYNGNGNENINTFITNKIIQLNTERATKKANNPRPDMQRKKSIRDLKNIQKMLKKIEKKLIPLYIGNENNKALKLLLKNIMDMEEFHSMTKKGQTTTQYTGNDDDGIRLPHNIADIQNKINKMKNEIKKFQTFINIGYV
jgi:hypothetical protein